VASHLNYVPGQAPTPNKVDIQLSPAGTVDIYNAHGSVHLLADVVGYYTPATIDDLSRRIDELEAAVQAIESTGTSAAVLARLDALEATLDPFSLETVDGRRTVRISAANLQLVDGTGDTDGTPNGLGNLMIGYAESHAGLERGGSHNVVLGRDNEWSSFGGLVTGRYNRVAGEDTAVIGGRYSDTTGAGAVSIGGLGADVSGEGAVGVGGTENSLSGVHAVAVAGLRNEANGPHSLAAGGWKVEASGDRATVIGGFHNDASGTGAVVAGGDSNTATAAATVAIGGADSSAAGHQSVVVGSQSSVASGSRAVSLGDRGGEMLDQATSVGGRGRTCTNQASCVEPGLLATSVAVLADGSNTGPSGLTTSRLGIGEYEVVLHADLFGTVEVGRRPYYVATTSCPATVGITGTETTDDGTHLETVTVRLIAIDAGGFLDCPVNVSVTFDRP
jgi:hypothetical protein